ncbi:unnamed protein product [Rotaria sp. Silwood1]|nr:unnamed protein product [Rotaria sp. Silwood1]
MLLFLVLKKARILQKAKTAEHIKTERQVLEAIHQIRFLVSFHHAFQNYVSDGELFTYLNKRQHFSEQDAKIYITDLTFSLGEVHKNILLNSEGHIVLADFGLIKECRQDDADKRTYSFCGTIEYTAPEIVKSGDAEHDLTSSFFQNYELIDRKGFLGKGSYSICRRCQNRRTREEFAVKIVSLRQEIDTKNEIDLLNLCQDHANIVRLHEVYFNE